MAELEGYAGGQTYIWITENNITNADKPSYGLLVQILSPTNMNQKVLVCPEMTYQVDIMDELLIDPLPADVKPFIVKRGYWLPDEAASVYTKAHTVLSFECHSPIIAAANGTPMFYLRQSEDTIKGQMYYDLGFDDWTFEIEQTSGKQITDKLLDVWKGYDKAKAKIKFKLMLLIN